METGGCLSNTSDAEDEEVSFDYCSVHVSTVISHVSQQFRFLIFFIVTQWVVSVQWNYFYKLEYLSLMVVQVSLNGLKRCTKIFGLMALSSITPEICVTSLIAIIRNHVDKYVITKHYYQLMPLSLATYVHQMLKMKELIDIILYSYRIARRWTYQIYVEFDYVMT
ncbi:hypothetical protein T08_5265 [Trichinella sp. T8]|nr:hypothetical protein T08_5265 [Trichinella sp. T8]